MNQPPLNPDALEAAARALLAVQQPEVSANYAWNVQFDDGREELRKEAAAAVSAYLAAALPEVTSVEEFLALHPGTYLLCADEVVRAKFLTVPREWMLPARVLYRPDVNDA